MRKNGLGLGRITNGGDAHQRATIRALDLEKYFASILISESEGLRKPDPRIFARAAQQLGVGLSEAVFVRDHPTLDIGGAHSVGMRTIWMRDEYWGECQQAGAAKILIDPFLSDNPSWDKGWIGSRAGEDPTQGGGR